MIAALREHLAQGTAIGPEGARHGLVDHCRGNHGVRFGVGQAAAVRHLLEPRLDRLPALDIGGLEYASLQQPHPHGAEIIAADSVAFNQQVAPLGRLAAQLDIVIAAAFERQHGG